MDFSVSNGNSYINTINDNPRDLVQIGTSYYFYLNDKNLLGEGAFAKVYLGYSTVDNTKVAIKRVNLNRLVPELKANLFLEINFLKSCKHDNVITLYDSFIEEDTGICYMVMEVCDKHLLKYREDVCKEYNVFPLDVFKKIVGQLAEVMIYLHHGLQNGRPVIHRNLNPQNIMMIGDRLKLSSFGLMKSMESMNATTDSVLGTPMYLAPEIVGQGFYDYRADLFSLGLIFFHLYFGVVPYQFDSQNKLFQFLAELFKNPNLKIEYPEKIDDPNLKSLLDGLLAGNPFKRMDTFEFYNHPFVQSCLPQKKVLKRGMIAENLPSNLLLLCPSISSFERSTAVNGVGGHQYRHQPKLFSSSRSNAVKGTSTQSTEVPSSDNCRGDSSLANIVNVGIIINQGQGNLHYEFPSGILYRKMPYLMDLVDLALFKNNPKKEIHLANIQAIYRNLKRVIFIYLFIFSSILP